MSSLNIIVYGQKYGTLNYNNFDIGTRIPVLRIEDLLEDAEKYIANREDFEISTSNNRDTCVLMLSACHPTRYLHLEYTTYSAKGKLTGHIIFDVDIIP